MTPRALRSVVRELEHELRSPHAVLEAVARAMHDRRGLPAPSAWEHCAGVERELAELLDDDDALGVVYQALNAPALEAAYRATARDARKFTDAEIPAVTGLFTPRWVAEFLIQQTLAHQGWHGHVLMPVGDPEMRPRASVLAHATQKVRDLRILDPACGTMNFGLAAVEPLRRMYRDEMDHAGRPGWPAEPSVRSEDEVAASILRCNLFGVDVDPVALWLARLSLGMKLRIDASGPNLQCADALFDGVGHDFDVVLTNPPYLSARNLPAATVRRLKARYPSAWRDLYACFIDRCLDLCRDGGRVGLLTMQSFMFTGAFERLRTRVAERAAVERIAHFGPGVFDCGNAGTLQTVALTLRKGPDASHELFAIRLTDVADKSAALRDDSAPTFRMRQDAFASLPRRAWAYWASPDVRSAFAALPKLGQLAPPRQGLATTDNARFVRRWWEVAPTASPVDAPCRATAGRWFPYAKSGRFRRWYEAPRHRVNWQDDGREIKAEILRRYPYLGDKWQWVAKNAGWYGKPGGVTYSYLTSGRFSARRLEPGSIFDVAGSSLFPEPASLDPLAVLALLNSAAASQLLHVINPTLNFQVGDLAELPIPPVRDSALAALAAEAIELQRRLDTFDETSPDFEAPMPWPDADDVNASIRGRLLDIEAQVDRVSAELYGIADDGSHAPRRLPPVDRADLARRWVSFAVRRALRRWPVLQLDPAPVDVLTELRGVLSGTGDVDQIESAVGGLADFLARGFYPWHVRLYAKRPILWAFGGRGRTLLVAHDHADAATLRHVFHRIGQSLPAGWERNVDDGIAVNLAPLAGAVADRALAKALAKVDADLRDGRYAWSLTASRGSSGGSGRPRSAARPPKAGAAGASTTARSAART